MNRYPYHRYLRYLVLEGEDVDGIRENIASLGFVPPLTVDCEFLISTLRLGRDIDAAWRSECDVDVFDDDSDDMRQCHWLVECGPARGVAEKALLDGLSARHTSTIVSLKFGARVSEKAVSLFRRGWWDTEELSLVDFANYFAMAGRPKPDPPPGVPLHLRPAYAAWDQGLMPSEEELPTDDIIRALQVDAYMAYNKAKELRAPASQEEARKWATLALRVSQVRRPAKSTSPTGQQSLPVLKPAIYYPEHNVPSLAELEDADDTDPLA